MATVLQKFGKILSYPFLNSLCSTLRVEKINADEYEKKRKNSEKYILAFWHGTMLGVWYLERPKKNEKIATFASRSPDGEMIVGSMFKWGYEIVRGSSRDGSMNVRKEISEKIENDYSIFIVPDGPVGPYHQIKFGAIRFAQKHRVPLFLVGVGYEKKKIFKSWDKFELPKYFSKCYFNFSNAIYVDENLKDLESERKKIENQMHQLQIEANNLVTV